MKDKVLLTTVFSGYNYGSILQALAGKLVLGELGYDCQLVGMKSLVKGRDIRLKKLLTILYRSFLLRRNRGVNALSTYQKSLNKTLIGDSVSLFAQFLNKYLQPNYLSWEGLKKAAKDSVACFAGSDQIWNSSTMYIDPMYYLRFAPASKRIAFAPSFGRDFIADYNVEKMSKWIGEFASLSVREDSGVKLIKDMTGRDAINLVDPTLIVDGDTWKKYLGIEDKNENYILAYFLDKPSELARRVISELKELLSCEVIAIPYQFDEMDYYDKLVPTGPVEFLDLINNAKCVLTDSFHGTVFSLNMHTPFYVFARDYGSAHSQNSRVESILKKMHMQDRFEPSEVSQKYNQVDFSKSEEVLKNERTKARDYLKSALNDIQRNEK